MTRRRGQSLPKGSVVRHSKIGPPMTLWVNCVESDRGRPSVYIRIAPKADLQPRWRLPLREATRVELISS